MPGTSLPGILSFSPVEVGRGCANAMRPYKWV